LARPVQPRGATDRPAPGPHRSPVCHLLLRAALVRHFLHSNISDPARTPPPPARTDPRSTPHPSSRCIDRLPPAAAMARRARDRRFSLEFLLHPPPMLASATGGRHQQQDPSPTSPCIARSVATTASTANAPRRGGGHAAEVAVGGCPAPPNTDVLARAPRVPDSPRLVPLPLTPPPRPLLLLPPPSSRQASRPRPLPARASTPSLSSAAGIARVGGIAPIGRAQRAALEARAWAASHASVVANRPPPTSMGGPLHGDPWRMAPTEMATLPQRWGTPCARRPWRGVDAGSPVTSSPVTPTAVDDGRCRQGRRQLQPLLLPQPRASDAHQASHVRPPVIPTATTAQARPVSATIGGPTSATLPRRRRQAAAPTTTGSRSTSSGGTIAKARVLCTRGCGATFGSRSGTLMCARWGGGACSPPDQNSGGYWGHECKSGACSKMGAPGSSLWRRGRPPPGPVWSLAVGFRLIYLPRSAQWFNATEAGARARPLAATWASTARQRWRLFWLALLLPTPAMRALPRPLTRTTVTDLYSTPARALTSAPPSPIRAPGHPRWQSHRVGAVPQTAGA